MTVLKGLVEGSESPVVVSLFNQTDGLAADLTGYTAISFKYRIDGGTLVEKTPTVTTAASGLVTWTPATTDLTPGGLAGRFAWTDASSKVHKSEQVTATIDQDA